MFHCNEMQHRWVCQRVHFDVLAKLRQWNVTQPYLLLTMFSFCISWLSACAWVCVNGAVVRPLTRLLNPFLSNDINVGAVDTDEVGDASLTGIHVLNNSLSGANFNESMLSLVAGSFGGSTSGQKVVESLTTSDVPLVAIVDDATASDEFSDVTMAGAVSTGNNAQATSRQSTTVGNIIKLISHLRHRRGSRSFLVSTIFHSLYAMTLDRICACQPAR